MKNLVILSLTMTLAGYAASGPEVTVLETRPKVIPPEATVKIVEANYCFDRFHALEVERLPVPPLVLQLKVQVSYHDAGNRPLILPLTHDVNVYTALKPGLMKIVPNASSSSPKLKVMEHLPPDVSPQSPVTPANDAFTIIPAGGEMNPPLVEDLTIPVYKKSIRQKIDLRGRKLYVRLQFDHQPLSPQLESAMSDRWTRFGEPWTGRLRSNTLLLDIPALPVAKECVDVKDAHYPHQGLDKLQGAQAK
jgi:hypothetical protein